MLQRNVLAISGRAVEAAGDVDVLLLDKTGTITLETAWPRFHPAPGVQPNELPHAAQLSSLADETPEGRSIVVLAKEKFGLRAREMHELRGDIRAVHRADADERCRSSCQWRPANHAHPQRRGRSGARLCRISGGNLPAGGRENG